MTTTFSIPTTIHMGGEALERLRTLSIKKVLLVCDPFLSKNGGVKVVTERLEAMGAQWELFDQIVPDPTVDLVNSGVARILDYRPDAMIALGGGAAMDAGKAINFIYSQMSATEKPIFIAIPTTSGTGSEVTSFSVLSDPQAGMKYPLVDDRMLPEIALLDPSLALSVPPAVTADTGLDVLTHALEAYASPNASDFTDALAEKAVALVFGYLLRAVKNGGDFEARERMHNASCMAGIAFNNASLGLCHGMAHPLGALLHLPHGRSNALLLPQVVAFNAGLGESGEFPARGRYAALAKQTGCCCYTETVAVQGLVRRIQDLMTETGMPRKLEDAEHRALVSERLDSLAEAALADRCTGGNPRPARSEQVKELYRKLL